MKKQESKLSEEKSIAEKQPSVTDQRVNALADCEQRCAEYEDKLLRLRAELENQNKRSMRELEKARKYAVTQILEELLPVKDSLELGLESGQKNASIELTLEGLGITLELFETVLKNYGVQAICPLGELFNPEHHEAMSVLNHSEMPPNTVIEVHQKGYLLHDRVIRPARVTVSKSPEV